MLVIGIDIGSQSLKAVVADGAMSVLGEASVAYTLTYPRPGWAEQQPRLWLDALRPAIGKALANAGTNAGDVAALAVCGQLDGCIPTAADGTPLAACLPWMDRRAAGVIRGIDAELVRNRAGLVLDATHLGAKIRWFLQHLDQAAAVATWHQPVSFVVAALTGVSVLDHGLASTSMLYSLAARDYDSQLLAAFGVDGSSLPQIADAASGAGGLTGRGVELTGLPPGLPVAVGTGDDFSGLLGCGVVAPGTVCVSLGTAEIVGALTDTPTRDPSLLVETHAFPGGGFHLGNPGWLSGGAINWFLGTFSVVDDSAFTALAATAPAGAEGLLFLPALSGAMAPRWVASARGAFYGLTPAHTKAHCARAVLEGTAFAMRDVVDRLDQLGVRTDRIRLVGGGARSPLWAQIRSDVCRRPVDALPRGDASARGAAMLASVAAGAFPTIAAAAAAVELDAVLFAPDAATGAVYDKAYAGYRRLFTALQPVFDADASAQSPDAGTAAVSSAIRP